MCLDQFKNLHKNLNRKLIWQESEQDYVALITTCTKLITSQKQNSNILRVLVHQVNPFIIIRNTTKGGITGLVGDIWNIIDNHYNYNHTLMSVKYTEGIRQLENGEADIFFAPAIANRHSSRNVLFSQPYIMNWYDLYMKSPENIVDSKYYVTPFSFGLWMVTLIYFISLTAITWVTGRILKRINPVEPNISIPSCFLGVISGLINQGFELKFKSNAARILIITSLILGYILYSALSSVLYSRMTVYYVILPVNKLSDIPLQKTVTLCVRNESYAYGNYFLDDNEEILSNWNPVLNTKECMDFSQKNFKEVICKSNIVILENTVIMSSFFKTELNLQCDVVKLNQKHFITGNSFVMAKNLKEYVDIRRVFAKMKSSGIIKRLTEKYMANMLPRESQNNKWYQVTINHISGVLVWYFSMMLLCLVILGIEILIHKESHPEQHEKFYQWVD